jgi:hypothetical protein
MRASPAVLLVLSLAFPACRDKSASATADPTPSVAPSASTSAKPPAPTDPNAAVVNEQRTEIPRAGNPPVVLLLPVVSGLRDEAMNAKVNALLKPDIVLGESLDDVRDECKAIKPGDVPLGVQGAETTVLFNDRGILELRVVAETMGAYPSANVFHTVIDLWTGETVTRTKAFASARIPGLVARLDAKVKAEAKASPANKESMTAPILASAEYVVEELDAFEITKDGITFTHDYMFPHVALALQPEGRFPMKWSEIAPDIDPKGPLSRLLAK